MLEITASGIQRMIYGIVENKSLYKGVFVVWRHNFIKLLGIVKYLA